MFKIFHNKLFIKIISLAICFVMFFSLTTVSHAGPGDKIQEKLTEGFQKLFNKILQSIAQVIVSLGDGVIHMMAQATGEVVTIDKLVFNKVDKVSIDYWDKSTSNATQNSTPIKNYMTFPIKKWYKVFNAIAIVVCMITIVYIGILVMLSSTGEKRARYKELAVTWFIGVAILFMFPYVMKYIVKLNDAFVNSISGAAETLGFSQQEGTGGSLANMSFIDVGFKYGTYEFGEYMGTGDDILTFTRNAALGGKTEGETEKDQLKANIVLAIVYDILVGQTLVVLVMYYKRAFMIAFLIVIFPLVAMMYVLDKVGDGKSQSFGIWFKEFLVNVIVQLFHATIYVLVTAGGIKTYLDSSGTSFIFMFMCVLFLFEGEKILRGIFGIQSQANTMGDLATTGAVIMSTAKVAKGIFKRDNNKTGSKQDEAENSAATRALNQRTQGQTQNEKAAMAALNEKEENGESTASYGEYQGKDREPEGVSNTDPSENARNTALVKAMKRRLNGGIATGAVNFMAGTTGAILETSRVMADGKSDLSGVIGAVDVGRNLGKTFATPLAMSANKIERGISGARLARKISNGKMDSDLGIDLVNETSNIAGMSDIDPNSIAAQKGLTKQDIYREALAAYAKNAARKGKHAGEEAYFDYIEKVTKK